jgi:hypothetical protein
MATQITLLPKDAEGHEIPLDTEYLYKYDGKKQEVLSFTYDKRKDKWEIETNSLITDSTFLYLNKPDNWGKLEEDLNRCISGNDLCRYFSKSGMCCDCTINPDSIDYGCDSLVFNSIKERVHKLRNL